jgi:hypothetical protein
MIDMNRYNIPVVNPYKDKYQNFPRFILRNNFSDISTNISRWDNIGYNKVGVDRYDSIIYIMFGIKLIKRLKK